MKSPDNSTTVLPCARRHTSSFSFALILAAYPGSLRRLYSSLTAFLFARLPCTHTHQHQHQHDHTSNGNISTNNQPSGRGTRWAWLLNT